MNVSDLSVTGLLFSLRSQENRRLTASSHLKSLFLTISLMSNKYTIVYRYYFQIKGLSHPFPAEGIRTVYQFMTYINKSLPFQNDLWNGIGPCSGQQTPAKCAVLKLYMYIRGLAYWIC